MILLYSGTPGSGKSLHLAADILNALRAGRNVICNFPVKLQPTFKQRGDLVCKDNTELTVPFLIEYWWEHHDKKKESQTYVIIDECAVMFNARGYQNKERRQWVSFFQLHRKLGYDIILVAQKDKLIDRQILAFVEYEYKHRNCQNYGIFGVLLKILHIKLFVYCNVWYGMRTKVGSGWFRYHKKYSDIYDTYAIFDLSLLPASLRGKVASDGRSEANSLPRTQAGDQEQLKKCQVYLMCELLRARIADLKEAE